MSKLASEEGVVSAATNYLYGPLIDAPPSHPDTVLTSIHYIEQYAQSQGQMYIHLTADLQLYKIAMMTKWSHPVPWRNLIVRPGGMHTWMSFIGCIGTLMKGSGVEELLLAAYKGVANMLNGKAWPKALRGLRMVTVCLVRDFVLEGISSYICGTGGSIRSSKEFPSWKTLGGLPHQTSDTCSHISSSREGGGLPSSQMMPNKNVAILFAAGHRNYARYLMWHIEEFQNGLEEGCLSQFMAGLHVCRHRSGSWNAVFSDQFGEQTYIRQGKAKGGLVGMTLSADQVAGWILSYPVCHAVSSAMAEMFVEDTWEQPNSTDKH